MKIRFTTALGAFRLMQDASSIENKCKNRDESGSTPFTTEMSVASSFTAMPPEPELQAQQ
jgi:hypothetical protein